MNLLDMKSGFIAALSGEDRWKLVARTRVNSFDHLASRGKKTSQVGVENEFGGYQFFVGI